MKCPVCAGANMVRDTRDISYTYKGETTTLPQLTGQFCPACDESLLDLKESGRAMRMMAAWKKEINAGMIDPKFIAEVRKAAEIFGGGANAFSRYETGKTKPSLALVKLLKMLDRHPELLSEVRAA
jgi:HTH-type transcriptional regulator / antitoxin MqsA